MRRSIIVAAGLALLACAMWAGEIVSETLTITHAGAMAASVSASASGVEGTLHSVHVILGTATNVDVDIILDPYESTADSITLYSEDDVVADELYYFVRDRNAISTGALLTSDPPGPYVLGGDTITVTVSDWAVTQAVVRVRIVTEK